MNSEQIILTDHDSVSGQLVAGSVVAPGAGSEAYWLWRMFGVCLIVGIVLGISRADNPTDQLASVLALLPLCFIGVDLCIIGQMLYQQIGMRALGLPLGAGGLHLLIWAWAQYLAGFEVYYRLEMHTDFYGIYEVRLGIVVLLGGLSLLALGLAVYEIGVAGQLFGELSIPVGSGVLGEDDAPLEGDHIFDAQVLLNNVGYDIGGIDGVLGPKTQTALKQYQAVTGLAPEGVVTILTLSALRGRGQQYERLSWVQTCATFTRYWVNRAIGFLQTQWVIVRNR